MKSNPEVMAVPATKRQRMNLVELFKRLIVKKKKVRKQDQNQNENRSKQE